MNEQDGWWHGGDIAGNPGEQQQAEGTESATMSPELGRCVGQNPETARLRPERIQSLQSKRGFWPLFDDQGLDANLTFAR